ncbi:protein-L-isoaspartate(D-aspartate) O-methyltransferase [Geobacter sp. SVR]|uniref:protein-L-isoaspartate(D-aspartate) O-methyltransferase n=1 Tax=Geobacter sp. SVR TaxID=2495594 RepID=UPI00143EF761|nr:protein-L-isoaspartate(D-aspartate) O-methyltransferase [Geobacter sp. SVR]BCS52625.1 protein-L-isoaspartate O-methyltransferase [Geobacter sp. SVR]GCF83938.1 protein-L-isoaspartate O-methyltransferase [Geobacter sp. SVR]
MSFDVARRKMVQEQIVARGISDRRVVEAMLKVPRHIFVQEAFAAQAYSDSSLPIGEKQTISQPYTVALMTELLGLTGTEKVLEIGTGSGYQTAILATLADRVFTAERIRPLALRARKCLDSLALFNVMLRINDGEGSPIGWEEEAPFDAIIVTAGAPAVPAVLTEQLAPNGRLVIPVGDEEEQRLLKIERQADGTFETAVSVGCRFVPLIGKQGW